MRVYLDNCCYNRPYDDQSHIRIQLETQAKLHIQNLIKDKKIQLVTSYMLEYENGKNTQLQKKKAISDFMNENESFYVGIEHDEDVVKLAEPMVQNGIKEKDAIHVSCAVLASCDYFITTDDRLLRHSVKQITMVTPEEFIRKMGDNNV